MPNILIVDDSSHVRKQHEAFLKSNGYNNLIFAESADEAFHLLGIADCGLRIEKNDHAVSKEDREVEVKKQRDEIQIPKSKIDLILMDIEMPDMDGIEACRKIKANEDILDIPIIMITVKSDREHLQKAFGAGAVDYITKPVDKFELFARVGSALKLKSETDARKARELELSKKIEELNNAVNEIKILRGILPICAHCKKIRKDDGYWQQLEVYIAEHSYAQFSHCICNECRSIFYPDLD